MDNEVWDIVSNSIRIRSPTFPRYFVIYINIKAIFEKKKEGNQYNTDSI